MSLITVPKWVIKCSGEFCAMKPFRDSEFLLILPEGKPAYGSFEGPQYPQTPIRGEFTTGINISSPQA